MAAEWICDYSAEEFKLDRSGWNTFSNKWRGKTVQGNFDCIRGFGIAIAKGGSARTWRGVLYVDDVQW